MTKQNTRRMLIGGAVVLAGIFGYIKFSEFATDPDIGGYNSVGDIVAIEKKDGATTRAVIFKSDGKSVELSEPAEPTQGDLEASWSLDGNRVFLSSNRKTKSYLVHRWNPEKNSVDIKREMNSMFQSAPWFGPAGDPNAATNGLILSGGAVLEYETRTGNTLQVLPPVSGPVSSGEGQGNSSPMEAIYKKFGDSFRAARYMGRRDVVLAVMRGDNDYVVLLNRLYPNEDGGMYPPQEIFSKLRAKEVAIDVAPDGSALIMVSHVRVFAELGDSLEGFEMKDGQPVPPFASGLFKLTMEGNEAKLAPIMVIPTEQQIMSGATLSPDGSQIAVVIDDTEAKVKGMVLMPFKEGGAGEGQPLIQGNVSTPSFSPDGKKIAFIKFENSFSNVYVINTDGSNEKKMSSDGYFSNPKFSPQLTAAK